MTVVVDEFFGEMLKIAAALDPEFRKLLEQAKSEQEETTDGT